MFKMTACVHLLIYDKLKPIGFNRLYYTASFTSKLDVHKGSTVAAATRRFWLPATKIEVHATSKSRAQEY